GAAPSTPLGALGVARPGAQPTRATATRSNTIRARQLLTTTASREFVKPLDELITHGCWSVDRVYLQLASLGRAFALRPHSGAERHYYSAVHPQSMSCAAPVIPAPASEQRKS